ncbi:MAG: M43 family zinc metalloprotease [Bacteroidota bacterium]|nr:M43 family zinc metalloprotease [Bacteroidota bacterium]MDP3145717.1 M43 family zinc metalloprotease [Bacteroidota bacterium]MDP3558410.1 M43 family zinc metalloprotease [Bacteroidota bacterium]
MKTKLSKLALGFAILSAVTGFSQSNKIQPCVTIDAMEEYFKLNPDALKNYELNQAAFQKQYLEDIQNQSTNKSAAVQYTIPVVFHILHLGGAENISDAAVNAALAQVNSDFAAAGSDANTIFAPFQALYINSDMKFMLAKKDPSGNCTSGIVHRYDSRTNWDRNPPSSAFNPALFAGITWDATKYLNIIIVKNIVAAPNQNGTVVGYTTLPGNLPTGASQDAIIYNYSFLSGLNARSLSHEIGHWFNLTHTFGNTNNPGVVCGSTAGGDGVSDTPDTKGNFSTCPASSTNTAFTCTSPNPSNPANYYQNVENIMDYSSCPKNFTSGQTTRMRNAAASSTSGRNNLWSSGNLSFTDVNSTGFCAPIAEFLSTTGYTVCSGGSLFMKDFSYNGVITNYAWSVDNGAIVASPTASNTSITFPNQGVTTVTLLTSNSQGSSFKVRTVNVLNGTPYINGNYVESFENPGVPSNWNVTNLSTLAWNQTNIAAKDGTGSFYVDGSNSSPGDKVILDMPVMDVLNNPSNLLKFSYAYARQTATQNDKLVLQGSTDCGGSWVDVVGNLSAQTMQSGSGGVTATPFVPTAAQWKEVDVTTYPFWFNFLNSQSASFRFVFTEDPAAGGGNRLFLDAVSFEDPNGINELTKKYKLNLFPNPSNAESTLKFNLSDAATVNVSVIDVLGKDVLTPVTNNYGVGEQSITINNNNTLAKGIYFVNISINGAKMSKKLVIN